MGQKSMFGNGPTHTSTHRTIFERIDVLSSTAAHFIEVANYPLEYDWRKKNPFGDYFDSVQLLFAENEIFLNGGNFEIVLVVCSAKEKRSLKPFFTAVRFITLFEETMGKLEAQLTLRVATTRLIQKGKVDTSEFDDVAIESQHILKERAERIIAGCLLMKEILERE